MDILARGDAPLSGEQWSRLDEVVVSVARKYLVGRRVLPIFGPLGAGLPMAPAAKLGGLDSDEPITVDATEQLPLEQISRDFWLDWRDVAQPDRLDMPLDMAAPAAATYLLAQQEDQIVFHGSKATGQPGLLGVKGAQKVKRGDWAEPGGLLADYAKAIDVLGNSGFPGPYALLVSPGTYALAHRPIGGAQLEIQLIKQQATVLSAAALSPEQAIVMEPGSMNADLALGLDMAVAYMGAEDMKHPFRILETLALRVKRPGAITVIG